LESILVVLFMRRASFASSLSTSLESLLPSLSPEEEGGFALVFLDMIFSLALSARSLFALELEVDDSMSSPINILWEQIFLTTSVMVRVEKSFSKRSALTMLYLAWGAFEGFSG
jgi:hypothetical protein